MAKCKICKTNIPEGKEYCKNCQDKNQLESNESYLDSLLNSVKNTVPTTDDRYKKKSNNQGNETKIKPEDNNKNANKKNNSPRIDSDDSKELDLQDYESYIDMEDIEDYENFNMNDDLNESQSNIVISDEELFGKDLSDILSDNEQIIEKSKDREATPSKESSTSQQSEFIDNSKIESEIESENDLISNQDTEIEAGTEDNDEFNDEPNHIEKLEQDIRSDDQADNQSQSQTNLQDSQEEIVSDMNIDSSSEMTEQEVAIPVNNSQDNVNKEAISPEVLNENIDPNEISEYEDDNFDPDLNDLLNSLDNYENEDSNNTFTDQSLNKPLQEQKSGDTDEFEQIMPEEDDFLALLNQMAIDDPVSDDIKAINDLLNTAPVEKPKKASMPSSVGEVFSDALKVVSSLNDGDIDEAELLSRIPSTTDKGSKKAKKKTAAKKKNKKTSKSVQSKDDGPKVSFFKRIFGNVKDESTAKNANSQQNLDQDGVAVKKPGKKAKAAKGKKGEAAAAPDESAETGRGKDRPGKEVVDDKKDNKKENKKEKKEKKKNSKEIIQVIDEIEEDNGRINRIGATIVFIFFGLLVLLLVVGTNMISYTLSIQNATNYFEKQKYTQAYDEVYGEKIKDADIEIYDKIMTINFVNKQLNSYNNYYSLGKYPEALDSLLKGLGRYDKYLELATMLGIKSDLDYVRTQILAELKNVFNLSEPEAVKINSYDSMTEYSKEVYDIVLENKGK